MSIIVNWHVLSSGTYIYSFFFFGTLLKRMFFFKILYWSMEVVQVTCCLWCLFLFACLILFVIVCALSSSSFFLKLRFWFHILWTPVSGETMLQEKSALLCYNVWCAIKFIISLFQSFPPPAAELQRTECLKSLREIANPLAERPARGDLTGEVCHWADGYHLNVKLYEKLLLSVFDVLDEGKLTEVS